MDDKRSALDIFGGFESYQKAMYDSLRDKIKRMEIGEIIALQRELDKKVADVYLNVSGLLDMGCEETRSRYFSNAEFLTLASVIGAEDPRNKPIIICEEDKQYWKKRINNEDYAMAIRIKAIRESDRIVKQKRQAA